MRRQTLCFGVRPFLCWYWKSPSARIVEHHRHWHCEMLLITRGAYEYTVKGVPYVARAGDCVLYKPWMAHSEENPPDDPPEYYHVKFIWPHAPAGLPLHVHDKDGRLKLMMGWLHDRYWSETPFSRDYSGSCLAGLLGEYLRLAEGPEPELVMRVNQYVRAHLASPITLNDLAMHVNLNRCYFARRYKTLTGVSPMHSVWRIRLAQARNLIMSSTMPLKAIAGEVGFSSESALSHAMQKQEHVTPLQLRGHHRIRS